MRRTLIVLGILLPLVLISACRLWAAVPSGLRPGGEPTATPTPEAPTPAPTFTPEPSPTAEPTALPSPTPGPPPNLVASYPIDGDMVVRAEFPLTLAFDRPLDRGSLEAGVSISPATAGTFEWPAEHVAVFRPEGGWTAGEYTVTVEGARSVDGTPLAEPMALRFGTGGRGVPVPALMYHEIRELDADANDVQRTWTVSPQAFAEQMAFLDREGWHSITPAQFVAYTQVGAPLPPKPVMITIDDGYKSVYEVVHPILAETDLRAVLFVIPSHMGYSAYITWEMTQELAAAGHEIGVHTLDHVALRGESADVLDVQVGEAKRLIEEAIGRGVDAFCYPFGSFDDGVIAALEAHGYTTAFTLNGLPVQPADDPYRLNRLLVRYETTLEEFAEMLP